MKSNMRTITVNGKTYRVWADYIIRGMCAEDENGMLSLVVPEKQDIESGANLG